LVKADSRSALPVILKTNAAPSISIKLSNMSSNGVFDLKQGYITAARQLSDNPGQWQAYESKGHCVLLAGPGSGKTKTLTTKLARMLAEDVQSPRGIACITFNSECADELQRRLEKLGVYPSRNVFVGTVHSFCFRNILLPYARLAELITVRELAVALPGEQQRVFEHVVGQVIGPNVSPENWRTSFDKYRRTHLDRNAPEWRCDDEQLAEMIEQYEAALRSNHLVDFDDIVLMGLNLIETHDWVRRCIEARFPILLVDEYQDLGLPLHRIVMSLCMKGNMRLFAVGDPDQSIYGFAGADPELLTQLSNNPNVETVELCFNYRSGQQIIDASEVVLGEARGYESQEGFTGTIDFYRCPEGLEQQAKEICQDIVPTALERREGRKIGDIAILYVDKNDGDVIEEAVRKANTKYIRLDRGAPYAKTPVVRWIENCAAWCAGGWQIRTPRLSALVATWERLNPGIQSEAGLHDLKLKLTRFLFNHRSPDMLASQWLQDIKSHLLDEIFGREPSLRDEGNAFGALVRAYGDGGKLSELTVSELGGQAGSSEHLNLLTLHSAKGLEYDVVVMMGMDQGKIPSWQATTSQAKRESRRLFYVGLTRARHEVHITFSGFTTNKYGRRFPKGPSEFVIEVAKRLREETQPL
jgi:DNA helicase-2/ATP-dependent DNA helicase PcrA